MPQHRSAGSGLLADVVGGEKRDARTDEDLDDIEQPRFGHEAVSERVVPGELMSELIGPRVRVAFQQPVDVLVDRGDQVEVDHASKDDVSIFFVLRRVASYVLVT